MIRRLLSTLDIHDRVGAVCGAVIFGCVVVLAYGEVQQRDHEALLTCNGCEKTAVAAKE